MMTETALKRYAYPPTVLNFSPHPLTDEQFEFLCQNHRDLKFELSSKGELIIVAPTSPESGWRNTKLTSKTDLWSETNGTGIVFDSSTMFTLPNGAKRSPDVSWMSKAKWDALSPSERGKFSRVVPDFVIELRSPSDNTSALMEKMAEYIQNGVLLAWLIDPIEHRVYIYRSKGEIEILDEPEKLTGEDVLPGFEFDVRSIW
ncbi:MAG: Uma2 family endonuclease [Pyrinomonadaceae bacterium]